MPENKPISFTDFMAGFRAKVPTAPSNFTTKGGLLEYMKSDEFKERVRKVREEYQ